ncbi:MFS transporter [Terriglobus tenax]|uniref:MFS transporter n=1 Tax=Terriglobus tenax TaxID=1111115 RepID=UPI0021E092AF|nr:MFS transporter [Terriglobus tenax]
MHPTTEVVTRKVAWRILPLTLVLYFIAYLDRVNIGFAAAAMRRDLGYSGTLFGIASGVFFAGYLCAQVPSNLALRRFGARKWIAIIMAVWGILSGLVAFTHNSTSFLILRFLLGVAESGFYPGIIYYLSIWLPRSQRTQLIAWFIFAIPLANIFGGPLSSTILLHGAVAGLRDWQVLLIVECLPAVLLAALVPFCMTDRPQEATWLTEAERATLLEAIAAGEQKAEGTGYTGTEASLYTNTAIYLFALLYFTTQIGLYGLVFWLPQMLSGLGLPQLQVGWTVAAVFLLAAVIMFVWSRLSDSKGQPAWGLSAPIAISAVGFLLSIPASHMPGKAGVAFLIVSFAIAEGFGLAATPALWSALTLQFPGTLAAPAIALVNALGNIGGFVGPFLLGWLSDRGQGYASGLFTVAAVLFVGTAAAAVVQRRAPTAGA